METPQNVAVQMAESSIVHVFFRPPFQSGAFFL